MNFICPVSRSCRNNIAWCDSKVGLYRFSCSCSTSWIVCCYFNLSYIIIWCITQSNCRWFIWTCLSYKFHIKRYCYNVFCSCVLWYRNNHIIIISTWFWITDRNSIATSFCYFFGKGVIKAHCSFSTCIWGNWSLIIGVTIVIKIHQCITCNTSCHLSCLTLSSDLHIWKTLSQEEINRALYACLNISHCTGCGTFRNRNIHSNSTTWTSYLQRNSCFILECLEICKIVIAHDKSNCTTSSIIPSVRTHLEISVCVVMSCGGVAFISTEKLPVIPIIACCCTMVSKSNSNCTISSQSPHIRKGGSPSIWCWCTRAYIVRHIRCPRTHTPHKHTDRHEERFH